MADSIGHMRPISRLRRSVVAVTSALAVCVISLSASGGIGVYGIVEKVVYEPNEQAPQRLQVWGAFAYVDGGAASPGSVTPARRGFLYFALPTDSSVDTVKTE